MKQKTSLNRTKSLRYILYATATTLAFGACAQVNKKSIEYVISRLENPKQTKERPQITSYTNNSCNSTIDGHPDDTYARTCSTHLITQDSPSDKLHPQVQKMYDLYTKGGKDSKRINRRIQKSSKYNFFLEGAAEKYNIPVELLRAQMIHESNMNETAQSPVGARGLMQIMPKTAKEIHPGCLEHITDPATSIYCGAKYLGQIMEKFEGNETMALAAYNWGPHRVKIGLKRIGMDQSSSCVADNDKFHMLDYPTLPNETRGYITKILATQHLMKEKPVLAKDIKRKTPKKNRRFRKYARNSR